MQTIDRTFPATARWTHDTAVGVVGSGDLEVLVTAPSRPGVASVRVRTSVDGFDTTWHAVLERFFERHALEGDYEINDFGATPGMVTLRLSQAYEAGAPETEEPSVQAAEPAAVARPSFTELRARDRVRQLLDEGSFRELVGPFDKVESAQLEPQGIVPQSDDGAVAARGRIDGREVAVVALEGRFQGGGIGEVSGAKVAAVLEKAEREARAGRPVPVVLLLETGGIRLQEANLGLLAIAEIHAGIVALKRHVPVVGVVAGTVGCFGGMGIAAGLTSHLVMTRAGRLSLNGPEVIETEAGVDELDASDRALVVRMARLRAEKASLLGYEHFAALVADEGCAASTQAIMPVLTRAAAAARRNAEREAQVLQERLQQIEPGATLEPWDWQHVADIVRGERYSLDEGLLRPYLEYERVLEQGVFAAATALYGITFHPRPDLVGYTPESTVYEVHEESGEVLGAVVLDPFTRPTKQGGAWMTSLVDQSTLLGTRPVVTNTCNQSRPGPGRPSLMSWDNVITLFHEFGHDLHGLLSDVRYVSTSGTATPQDFVEFPSQVNEIWAWEPSLLERYAVHHETGEPMPRQWIEQLLAAREFDQGYESTESYAAMLLDQAWHQTPLEELPTSADEVEEFEQRALREAGMDFPLVPPRYRTGYFAHIFGGGYAASYYSYMWSEVFDADTVAWFEEHGGLTRENGERFRRELLARGGSLDVREVYRRFRGADPDVQHLLDRHGLV